MLCDVYSGKSLRLDLGQLKDAEEKKTSDTGEAYLVLVLEDGRQLALAPVGVAWPPDPRNLPSPLPLPAVVCWRDFANVAGQVQHVIEVHRSDPPSREVLDMLLYCIALLDGARAIGFETAADERRIERYLDDVAKLGGAV